jgi:hypothetical protein
MKSFHLFGLTKAFLGCAELLGPTTSTAGSMLSAPPGCVTLIILSSDTVIVHDSTYILLEFFVSISKFDKGINY